MDQALIDQYTAGAGKLGQAIKGLSQQELTAFPVPGTWSIQQIVLHVMDSDLIAADRMKRVAAEEKPPTLIGYDESAFARNLFYHELDVRTACEVFEKNRQLTGEILRRLPGTGDDTSHPPARHHLPQPRSGRLPREAFARKGHHNEHGDLTLAELLKMYVDHLEHHLKFIREKRKLLGKPL